MPDVSVIVPVYRAENSLHELYRRTRAVLDKIAPDFELILVDDGGGDRSWEIIKELSASDPRVRGIQLSRNFGQHAATICGIASARGDRIITLDDDLEHPPESIPALYDKALEGFPLVYGVFEEPTHAWWRNLTSRIARRLFWLAIPSLNYEYSSFRVIDRSIAQAITAFDSPFPFVDGYLSWITNDCAIVPVEHQNRAHGGSNYTFKKLLLHTVNIFVTFSDLPLRLASWLGLISFLVGNVWLAVIVLRRLFGGITVSGFASIMACIILFGGIQLLILGVFGEYLGRMNFISSRKPLYLVSKDTGATRQEGR